MGSAVIRLGDSTSHGGRVVEATARFTVDGIPVARVGDACICPIAGHRNCKIIEGDPNCCIDGIPVAVEGCKTTCNATLIPSQIDRMTIEPIRGGIVAESSINGANSLARHVNSTDIYDHHFQLLDGETGEPLSDFSYSMMTDSGVELVGITDKNGFIDKIRSHRRENVTLYI